MPDSDIKIVGDKLIKILVNSSYEIEHYEVKISSRTENLTGVHVIHSKANHIAAIITVPDAFCGNEIEINVYFIINWCGTYNLSSSTSTLLMPVLHNLSASIRFQPVTGIIVVMVLYTLSITV